MFVLNLGLTSEGSQLVLDEGVWLPCRLTNCFIRMQTGPKCLWCLQQTDAVSPRWMTPNIASHTEPVLCPTLDSALFIKIGSLEIHWNSYCLCGIKHHFFRLIVMAALRCWRWGERLGKWSYTHHHNSPQGFFCSQHHKYQEAMTVIDSPITELWKSFNPFIKLNGGHLMHFTPAPLPIWLL